MTPSGYLLPCHCHSPLPPPPPSPPSAPLVSSDDDVDLEQLVNDMNSSIENVYSAQDDTALLLSNGHMHTPNYHHQNQPRVHVHHAAQSQAQRRQTAAGPPSSSSRDRLRQSQPMHIQAVRYVDTRHLLMISVLVSERAVKLLRFESQDRCGLIMI